MWWVSMEYADRSIFVSRQFSTFTEDEIEECHRANKQLFRSSTWVSLATTTPATAHSILCFLPFFRMYFFCFSVRCHLVGMVKWINKVCRVLLNRSVFIIIWSMASSFTRPALRIQKNVCREKNKQRSTCTSRLFTIFYLRIHRMDLNGAILSPNAVPAKQGAGKNKWNVLFEQWTSTCVVVVRQKKKPHTLHMWEFSVCSCWRRRSSFG